MKLHACIITAWFGISMIFSGAAYAAGNTFQDRDTNQDGKVSFLEFNTQQMTKFKEIDLDQDGYLTIKDLEKFKGKIITGIATFLADTLFKKNAQKYWDMDTNRDERISPEEFLNSKKAQFLDMDSNGDRFVSSEEFAMFKGKKRKG